MNLAGGFHLEIPESQDDAGNRSNQDAAPDPPPWYVPMTLGPR
jgi:hypothetical protein